ncbi:hypothetical protein Bca52824_023536 [Brassica carinata]|uniref:Uncharacterized protein n=1 Tax=Brassica carinata TaxID=52824 RepID=A0A8X8ASQ7_BRACI|nr:hypothetical protein Bca52824_023536 [Brassica carinata]
MVLVYFSDPKVQDKVVETLYPLRYKHLRPSGFGPLEPLLELRREVVNKRTASAFIINTSSCLESLSLSWLQQELKIPVYPLGPLHITAPAPSSLLKQDRSCIEWLNKQKPRSVIYISMADMETKEVVEMAWGLSNSNQPFLWVTRSVSITGADVIDSFPEELQSLPESDFKNLGPIRLLHKLNKECQVSFKDCLGQLLVQQREEIACVIYDEFMYFAEAAAKEFNLPNVIFSTTSATAFVCRSVFDKLYAENVLVPFNEPKEEQNELLPEFHPLRYKDFPVSRWASLESIMELYRNTVDNRTASSVIINTTRCPENSSLLWLQQRLEIPVYPVGPLHMVASVPTSVLEENKSCIEWLNKQKENSVIFVSLGSLALLEINEVMETALGLDSSNQHFLWVIRPGSIRGSEWVESLPEEFSKMVSERGYIVKWAPQKEVLAHPAVGGFWSHCRWNSTLESIGGAVPMICKPFSGDQKVNAR